MTFEDFKEEYRKVAKENSRDDQVSFLELAWMAFGRLRVKDESQKQEAGNDFLY